MTFKATTNERTMLKNIFKSLSNIVEETNIMIDNEGIRCDAINKAKTLFMSIDIRNEFFTDFKIDEPLILLIDTNDLSEALNHVKNNDLIIIECNEEKLSLTFAGKATRVFNIILLDGEYEVPPMPVHNYSVEFKMDYAVLKDAINDLQIYGSEILFTVYGNLLNITNNDSIKGNCNTTYKLDNDIKDKTISIYSLPLMEKILNAFINDVINIQLDTDMPLKLSLENENNNVFVEYLLAPIMDIRSENYV